jgi:hypothetical protein
MDGINWLEPRIRSYQRFALLESALRHLIGLEGRIEKNASKNIMLDHRKHDTFHTSNPNSNSIRLHTLAFFFRLISKFATDECQPKPIHCLVGWKLQASDVEDTRKTDQWTR